MIKTIAPVLAFTLLGFVPAAAQTEGYDSRNFARLSYVSGDVFVQRPGDMGYEAGTVNLVLVEGDKLGVQSGRLEVSFGQWNVLRLDGFSQAEFVNLPRDAAQPYKLHLHSGSAYLRLNRLSSDREFEIHTPDASLYVLTEGLFRLDVLENGQTRLAVIEGEAEASGEERSHTLRRGESVTLADGRFLSGPSVDRAGLDDFGQWSRSRDGLMARNRSSSYLPEELYEYESELADHGDWRYEADYGYVWVPRVRAYVDWRPYYYGRWVWYPIIGWTWIADEPWGWCVSHYGRWHWSLALGWYWIPTRFWGPAWVHWYWDSHYVGWCALNRWNRPVVVINNVFYTDYGRADVSVHNRALVVVNRRQLQAPRAAAVALRSDELSRLNRVALSSRQPGIAPAVQRSGRLSDEASRVFARSRGRSVERTFGLHESAPGMTRRFLEGRSVSRSGESAPAITPRAVRGRQEAAPRSSETRLGRGEPSVRTGGGIREHSLRGRSGGADLPSSRSRTVLPGGSALEERRSRLEEQGVRRHSGVSMTGPRAPERATPEAFPSWSSTRTRSSWSRTQPGNPSSTFEPGTSSGRRTAVSAPRTTSSPTYSRPDFMTPAPRSQSSSSRTFSSPGRSESTRGSFSPRVESRTSSRSVGPARSSSGPSRSVSQGRSSSRPSPSSSKNPRGGRRD